MSTAQGPEMVRHAVQVVPVWRDLRSWVSAGELLTAVVNPWWQRRWHVVREFEVLQRIVDERLDLIGEVAFRRKPLEMD